MQIPLALINFEGYDEGDRLIGLTDATLPDIEFATTDISGAGISGTLSFPIRGNFENFTTTLRWRTLTSSGAKYLNQTQGWHLSLRGAFEDYDAGEGIRKVVPVRCDMRVHATKLALGKFESGEQSEAELELMIDWIRLTVDGKEVFEVDRFNYKFNMNGQDIFADVNAALGR